MATTMDPASLQAGQLALAMMTPEQRKQAVEQALAKASPEERKAMEAQQREMQQKMEKASPEERAAMAQQAHLMKDMGVFCQNLRPTGGLIDRSLGSVDVLAAIAECPSYESLTTAIKGLEADEQKAVVRAFITLEQAILAHATATDAEALRGIKTKPEKKRPLLLLLWVLYHHKVGDEAVVFDETMTRYYEATKRLATQLLVRAQMVLPQQRWVQQTVAVSRVSALLVNELWSHEDEACIERMRAILQPADKPNEGLPFPELGLKARTVLAMSLDSGVATPLGDAEESCTCLPSQLVAVQIELTRGHAGRGTVSDDIADRAANPQGIIEAYWLYVEGRTPQGSTLLAAQPLTVTSLDTASLPAVAKFEAPKEAGEYHVTVYISSTSVVGCDMRKALKFVVEEDDVPALA